MRKLIVASLIMLCGIAHADILDMFSSKGVEGNPDTYAYVELLYTGSRTGGASKVPTISNFSQRYDDKSNGMIANFAFPIDKNTTFLLGGEYNKMSAVSAPNGDPDWTRQLVGQTGEYHYYGFNVGLRIYLHD